jgi:GTP-binding protein
MRIQSAEFVVSAGKSEQFPRGSWPEVAFAGRSNVGKSSFINRLLGQRKLARTSSTPGRTRTLNFYHINERFFLVDLPGYGYAKVSRTVQEGWWALVEAYLVGRASLRGVIHLVDARHPPTETDRDLRTFLAAVGLPSLIVLTKADKIGRGDRRRAQAEAARVLGAPVGALPILASAETGDGMGEAWLWVEERLAAAARAPGV